jgi:hypothetical protein
MGIAELIVAVVVIAIIKLIAVTVFIIARFVSSVILQKFCQHSLSASEDVSICGTFLRIQNVLLCPSIGTSHHFHLPCYS